MRIGVCLRDTEIRSVCVHSDGRIVEPDSLPISVRSPDSNSSPALSTGEFGTGLETVLTHYLSSSEEAITSVTFDVGSILRRRPANRVFIRVAPRAPVDSVHEYQAEAVSGDSVQTVNIVGGHSATGEELVPLDIAALEHWCTGAPHGAHYVITAVGSPSNASHERQVGEILIGLVDPDSVQYSHSFHSSSVEVRERTAAVNSALIADAEDLLGALQPVLGRLAPDARLYVTTNDGSCHPLARLVVAPIESLFTEVSTAVVGAAALSESKDGFVSVTIERGTFQGQFVHGALAVLPQFRTKSGQTLATKVANLVEVMERGSSIPSSAVLVEERRSDENCPPDESSHFIGREEARSRLRTCLSLCALGAVVTPPADWAHRVVQGTSEAEVRSSVNALESRVRARLVSFGAHDSQVVILESGVEATTYDNSNTVTVLVRATAFDPIPLAAEDVVESIPVLSGGTEGREQIRAVDHSSRT